MALRESSTRPSRGRFSWGLVLMQEGRTGRVSASTEMLQRTWDTLRYKAFMSLAPRLWVQGARHPVFPQTHKDDGKAR